MFGESFVSFKKSQLSFCDFSSLQYNVSVESSMPSLEVSKLLCVGIDKPVFLMEARCSLGVVSVSVQESSSNVELFTFSVQQSLRREKQLRSMCRSVSHEELSCLPKSIFDLSSGVDDYLPLIPG